MAKKVKVGFDTADKAAARLTSGSAGLSSTPAMQPATHKRDNGTMPEQSEAAAASSAQTENAMIQQILERQAVFGF